MGHLRMHRRICLENEMFFKKKAQCEHEYEEIGRYYFEEGYTNGNVLHACIVYKCNECGHIHKNWIYSKRFLPHARIETFRDAVSSLEANGFVKELDFMLSRTGKSL